MGGRNKQIVFKDKWEKLAHIWQIEPTEVVKEEIISMGEDYFWGDYFVQKEFARKHSQLQKVTENK